MYKLDILCLSETFLCGDNSIDVNGYKYYGNNRSKTHKKAKRGSGGVGILVKDTLVNEYDIEILDKSREGILWLKLSSLSTNHSLCICACYLPPKYSKHAINADPFYQSLLEDVYVYQNDGLICICGDFNSRIGDMPDYIEGADGIPHRVVLDYEENEHGNLLVNFLINSNMCTLNGRNGSDDNFTCISHKGRSVIDYFIVPYEQLHFWETMKVTTMNDVINTNNMNPPLTIPDHSLLTCSLKAIEIMHDGNSNKNISTKKLYNLKNIPDTYMNNKNENVITHIQNLEQLLRSEDNLNDAYADLNKFIVSEMDKHLVSKTKVISSHQSKCKSKWKPYWNDKLQEHWENASEKEKIWLDFKGGGNKKRMLKKEYCSARKCFDKLLRKYKRNYQKEEQEHLLEMSNSNQSHFWKKVKNIGIAAQRKSYLPSKVKNKNGTILSNHEDVLLEWKCSFEHIYTNSGTNEYDDNHLAAITTLNDAHSDELGSNEDLNSPISKKEVKDAIVRAKLRKAAGIDGIKAEVLKNNTCIELFYKLFNLFSQQEKYHHAGINVF